MLDSNDFTIIGLSKVNSSIVGPDVFPTKSFSVQYVQSLMVSSSNAVHQLRSICITMRLNKHQQAHSTSPGFQVASETFYQDHSKLRLVHLIFL